MTILTPFRKKNPVIMRMVLQRKIQTNETAEPLEANTEHLPQTFTVIRRTSTLIERSKRKSLGKNSFTDICKNCNMVLRHAQKNTAKQRQKRDNLPICRAESTQAKKITTGSNPQTA